MANYSKGRMITKDIARSKRIASLSKDSLILFFMLIPHLDSHGKMNGSPFFIKGEVVPLLKPYSIKYIEKCLKEIHSKTNLKWFESDGCQFLHATNWKEHQTLDPKKVGKDQLPSYSGVTPKLVQLQGEGEVEGEREVEGEGEVKDSPTKQEFGEFVRLTAEEHGKLVAEFGEKGTQERIARLNAGIGSKGYKYKSHYYTILSWDQKDKKDANKPSGNGSKTERISGEAKPEEGKYDHLRGAGRD